MTDLDMELIELLALSDAEVSEDFDAAHSDGASQLERLRAAVRAIQSDQGLNQLSDPAVTADVQLFGHSARGDPARRHLAAPATARRGADPWERVPARGGRVGVGRPQAPDSLYARSAVASTGSAAVASPLEAGIFASERITIGGIECCLLFSERPLRFFLKGSVPEGVTGFRAGGRDWSLVVAVDIDGLHVVGDDLTHADVDQFDNVGHWLFGTSSDV